MKQYQWEVEFCTEQGIWYIQKLVYMCCPVIFKATYDSETEAGQVCIELNKKSEVKSATIN